MYRCIDTKQKLPRTGPRPASSIPIMQGSEPHFGTTLSASIFELANGKTQETLCGFCNKLPLVN